MCRPSPGCGEVQTKPRLCRLWQYVEAKPRLCRLWCSPGQAKAVEALGCPWGISEMSPTSREDVCQDSLKVHDNQNASTV